MNDRALEQALPRPCSACPWRTANHGKPHPDGWYTVRNRARLWSQMRRGEMMSCHPTDPNNPVPPGTTPVTSESTHECAGSLVLAAREVMVYQHLTGLLPLPGRERLPKLEARDGLRAYRAVRGKDAMTRDGLLNFALRVKLGGTLFGPGGPKVSRDLDLSEDVGHGTLVWPLPK